MMSTKVLETCRGIQ